MAEGGGGALRDLLARFSVDVDTKSLMAFESGIAGVFGRLQKFAGIFAGMFALNELKHFVEGTIESAAELNKMAGRLQVSTDEFQKIQTFLRTGSDEAAAAIQRLNRGIGAAKGGERSPIEKLGISLKDAKGELKPTSELVLEMADKVSAMKTPAEKTAAVLDVFGRSAGGLIRPLSMGRKEAEKYFKEFEELGGVVDKKFIKDSVKAEHEMKKFKVVMGGIKRDAVAALLPTILKLAEGFKHLAMRVRGLVSTNNISHFIKMLQFSAVIAGIYKTISALRMLSLAALTNPFVLLIVGVVALALVIEDLWVMLEGGDSLIGDALGPDKEVFIENLKGAFQGFKDTLAGLAPALEGIGEALKGIFFEKLIEGLRNTFQGISVVVDWLGRLSEAISTIKAGGLDIQALVTGDFSKFMAPKVEGQMKTAPAGQTVAAPVKGAGAGAVASVPNKMDNSVKVTNNNTIHVAVETNSGQDTPDEVGRTVGKNVRTELDKTNVNAYNAGRKQ